MATYNWTKAALVPAMGLVCLLSAVSQTQSAEEGDNKPPAKPDAEVEKIVADNNQFAVDLYGKLSSQTGNLCYSPLSISTALAMTYAGARGGTAKEMKQALHFGANDDKFHAAYGRLLRAVPASSQKGKQQWVVANALWAQRGEPFSRSYLGRVAAYGATAERIDFQNSEAARRTINPWIARKTNNKIKELLAPDSLNPETRLVLTNALYFKSPWNYPFRPGATERRPFTCHDGSQVEVPLMFVGAWYPYARLDDVQAVEIPYLGREFSMIILLPDRADGLPALEKKLSAKLLADLRSQSKGREVSLSLPKFKISSTLKLNEALQALGMQNAFTNSADFSGMDDSPFLFLQSVIHQAYVDVHERGTEAAAATSVEAPKSDGGDTEKPLR